MFASHSKQLLVFLIIVTLITLGVWWFLYSAIAHEAISSQELVSNQAAAAAAVSQDQSLASFLADSSSTAATLLNSILPADDSVSFIEQIETLAKKQNVGLHVGSVTISTPTDLPSKASGFDDLDLSLSVQGSWSAVYNFIAILESLPYKLSVTNVSLDQSIYTSGKQTQSFWSGTISISVLKIKAADDTDN